MQMNIHRHDNSYEYTYSFCCRYVFSRVLADELGFGLLIEGGLLDENWKKGHIFPNMAEIPYNVESNAALPKEAFTSHSINLSLVLANRTPRTIKVAGFPFDDIDAFWKRREKIRNVYVISQPIPRSLLQGCCHSTTRPSAHRDKSDSRALTCLVISFCTFDLHSGTWRLTFRVCFGISRRGHRCGML